MFQVICRKGKILFECTSCVCGFTAFIYLSFYNSKQFICSAHDKKMFLPNNGDEGGLTLKTLFHGNCSPKFTEVFTLSTHKMIFKNVNPKILFILKFKLHMKMF